MKHKRITVWNDPEAVVLVPNGKMTFRKWLESERLRIGHAMSRNKVRIDTDKETGEISLSKSR